MTSRLASICFSLRPLPEVGKLHLLALRSEDEPTEPFIERQSRCAIARYDSSAEHLTLLQLVTIHRSLMHEMGNSKFYGAHVSCTLDSLS